MFKPFIIDRQPVLLDFFKNPKKIESYHTEQWSLLLRTARNSVLLAQVGRVMQQHGLAHLAPKKVKDHIDSAQTIIEYRKRTALWELNRLWRALLESEIEIIILKGGAYLLIELPFSNSRMFADIDILVNKSDINKLEQTLLNKNWKSVKLEEYDQHYYREWMHEIPPLRHITRIIEVDIHHTILPLTSRLTPDPQKLIDHAIESTQYGFKTLSPCDMYLHSATHLFYDSDLNNRLKDLVDLDQLTRHFSEIKSDFFDQLLIRGKELDLHRPLFYALHYSQKLLGTPVSSEILKASKIGAPPTVIRLFMDILVPWAILPEHPDHPQVKVAIARWLLYVRSHYLRMPLKLLLPHLLYKAKVRLTEKEFIHTG